MDVIQRGSFFNDGKSAQIKCIRGYGSLCGRLSRRATLIRCATTAVGGLAGFTSGLAGMAGPPIVLFMLGGPNDAGTVRANIVVFFALATLVGAAAYLAHGMITRATLLAALLLLPAYALGVHVGARSFGLASPDAFRRAAYLICSAAALLVAMPFW